MADSASRALALASRIEGQLPRSARELAAELGVTTRTIRRDIARLRDLGYPVDTFRGGEGGYRLQPGMVLAPLVLTPAEAVACAVALEHSAEAVAGDDASSALAKIRTALPGRLGAVADAIVRSSRRVEVDDAVRPAAYPVDAQLLGSLANACEGRRRLRFTYAGRQGCRTRTVDPLALVVAARRWYLVAFDLDAQQWRTLRVDRLSELDVTALPATDRGAPAADLDAWVVEQLAAGWQQVRAVVRAHLPAAEARRLVAPGWGTVEPEFGETCLLRVGADTYDAMAQWLQLLGAEVTVLEPEELRLAFARVAARAHRTAHGAQ